MLDIGHKGNDDEDHADGKAGACAKCYSFAATSQSVTLLQPNNTSHQLDKLQTPVPSSIVMRVLKNAAFSFIRWAPPPLFWARALRALAWSAVMAYVHAAGVTTTIPVDACSGC